MVLCAIDYVLGLCSSSFSLPAAAPLTHAQVRWFENDGGKLNSPATLGVTWVAHAVGALGTEDGACGVALADADQVIGGSCVFGCGCFVVVGVCVCVVYEARIYGGTDRGNCDSNESATSQLLKRCDGALLNLEHNISF